jgi:ribulose-phosphate 3-epimerase
VKICGNATAIWNRIIMEQKRQYKISASLICANILRLEEEIDRIVESGCDYIHFDIMDGVYVPRFGMYPEILSAVRKKTSLPIDVHFMTIDAEKYVNLFVDAGASLITVHPEACTHIHRTLQVIKKAGAQTGVCLNYGTPLSVLDYILDDINLVLIMAINPGIVGHPLIPKAIEKIADLRTKIDEQNKNIIIEVDGGVTFESAPKMLAAGAELLVCGSSTIFKPDAPVNIKVQEFRTHLEKFGFSR